MRLATNLFALCFTAWTTSCTGGQSGTESGRLCAQDCTPVNCTLDHVETIGPNELVTLGFAADAPDAGPVQWTSTGRLALPNTPYDYAATTVTGRLELDLTSNRREVYFPEDCQSASCDKCADSLKFNALLEVETSGGEIAETFVGEFATSSDIHHGTFRGTILASELQGSLADWPWYEVYEDPFFRAEVKHGNPPSGGIMFVGVQLDRDVGPGLYAPLFWP